MTVNGGLDDLLAAMKYERKLERAEHRHREYVRKINRRKARHDKLLCRFIAGRVGKRTFGC
jgi:hypothetical protein